MVEVSKHDEAAIIQVSRRVLHLAQNFDTEFPMLNNLKKTHFSEITLMASQDWFT